VIRVDRGAPGENLDGYRYLTILSRDMTVYIGVEEEFSAYLDELVSILNSTEEPAKEVAEKAIV
jgi:hypothetical protein